MLGVLWQWAWCQPRKSWVIFLPLALPLSLLGPLPPRPQVQLAALWASLPESPMRTASGGRATDPMSPTALGLCSVSMSASGTPLLNLFLCPMTACSLGSGFRSVPFCSSISHLGLVYLCWILAPFSSQHQHHPFLDIWIPSSAFLTQESPSLRL